MLGSMKDLLGYRVNGTDGEVGTVHDFFFDDSAWVLRYVVVDTGKWLPGPLRLLAPGAFLKPDWRGEVISVRHTREQVESSPPVDVARPVSRRQEEALFQHYDWLPYWPAVAGRPPIPPAPPASPAAEMQAPPPDLDQEVHLRSFREVRGYGITTQDGSVGHVEDFLLSDGDWGLKLLAVDTRNWLPGRSVYVAIRHVKGIEWKRKQVELGLTEAEVKEAPGLDEPPLFRSEAPVREEAEQRLYDYYGLHPERVPEAQAQPKPVSEDVAYKSRHSRTRAEEGE